MPGMLEVPHFVGILLSFLINLVARRVFFGEANVISMHTAVQKQDLHKKNSYEPTRSLRNCHPSTKGSHRLCIHDNELHVTSGCQPCRKNAVLAGQFLVFAGCGQWTWIVGSDWTRRAWAVRSGLLGPHFWVSTLIPHVSMSSRLSSRNNSTNNIETT